MIHADKNDSDMMTTDQTQAQDNHGDGKWSVNQYFPGVGGGQARQPHEERSRRIAIVSSLVARLLWRQKWRCGENGYCSRAYS